MIFRNTGFIVTKTVYKVRVKHYFKNSKSSDSNELNAKEGSYEDKRKTHIQS